MKDQMKTVESGPDARRGQVRREGRSLDRSCKLSSSSKRGSSTGRLRAGKTRAFNVAAAAAESAGWTSGVKKSYNGAVQEILKIQTGHLSPFF